jgi:hypothetical protein
MSSEMVERVARALALASLDEETRETVNLDAHMARVRNHYQYLARAAIEAMREPTDEMANKAIEASYGITRERAVAIGKADKWDGRRQDLINDYQIFINAALSSPAEDM